MLLLTPGPRSALPPVSGQLGLSLRLWRSHPGFSAWNALGHGQTVPPPPSLEVVEEEIG